MTNGTHFTHIRGGLKKRRQTSQGDPPKPNSFQRPSPRYVLPPPPPWLFLQCSGRGQPRLVCGRCSRAQGGGGGWLSPSGTWGQTFGIWVGTWSSWKSLTLQLEKITYMYFVIGVIFLRLLNIFFWNECPENCITRIRLRFRKLHGKLSWNYFLGRSCFSCIKECFRNYFRNEVWLERRFNFVSP